MPLDPENNLGDFIELMHGKEQRAMYEKHLSLGHFDQKKENQVIKKFIAVGPSSGHHSGGPDTRDKAVAWAKSHLTTNTKAGKVFICEVMEVVEPSQAPVKVSNFEAEPVSNGHAPLPTFLQPLEDKSKDF